MQPIERTKLELTRFTALRRRLIEMEPEIDETTLLDTLEGATNLSEAIGEVVRSVLNDETLAQGLKSRIVDMQQRLARIESTLAKKRQVALAAMEECGIERILEPDFTVSLRLSPPAAVIVNETDIPEQYWLPQPPKLDKRGILESLKIGTRVAGAELANSRVNLSIRTK